jgi:hypothetical protein
VRSGLSIDLTLPTCIGVNFPFPPRQAMHHLHDARHLTEQPAYDSLVAGMQDGAGKDDDPIEDLSLAAHSWIALIGEQVRFADDANLAHSGAAINNAFF